ncbi:MAG TPA: alpha/beta hydrolase [Myxococcales bacterium]|jgi:pimeloyl-ACP methyl ester carboxylesterase|nr:alpha/beta hydrolase [Myxococcales bacterium]
MNLHIEDTGGTGPAVVLHHGLGCDTTVWSAQIDHLRKKHRVIAFDARGHGKSPRAQEYSIAALAEDLNGVATRTVLQKFWLVGHSLAGAVLSEYAGRFSSRLLGLVYLDAVGDYTSAPQEMKDWFRKHDQGATAERLQEWFGEMLGPVAKPDTRRNVLEAVARMDVPAFAALRASMAEIPGAEILSRFAGPRHAIDALGTDNPYMPYNFPGVQRRTIPGVSHWLMLDDPAAVNAALDEVIT